MATPHRLRHDAEHARRARLPSIDPDGLPPQVVALLAELQQRLDWQDTELAERDRERAGHLALLQDKDRELALREARLEKVTFELARLKCWRFGVRIKAMDATQRRLFE